MEQTTRFRKLTLALVGVEYLHHTCLALLTNSHPHTLTVTHSHPLQALARAHLAGVEPRINHRPLGVQLGPKRVPDLIPHDRRSTQPSCDSLRPRDKVAVRILCGESSCSHPRADAWRLCPAGGVDLVPTQVN